MESYNILSSHPAMLGIDPGASHIRGRYSTTELYPFAFERSSPGSQIQSTPNVVYQVINTKLDLFVDVYKTH